MVTTTAPPRTRLSTTNGHSAGEIRLSPTKPRRNGGLIALGVLLMVGCGLIAAVLQMRATSKTAVLAVAHQIPAGQAIRSSDLATVEISGGDGLSAIAARDESSVVGKTAAVSMMPGTLMTRSQLALNTSVSKGKVVIGLALKPGQIPTSHLKAGDDVLVLATGSAAQLATGEAGAGENAVQGAVLVRRARVFDVDGGSRTGDSTAVSILIDETDAPAVGAAANAGQVTLVLQSAP